MTDRMLFPVCCPRDPSCLLGRVVARADGPVLLTKPFKAPRWQFQANPDPAAPPLVFNAGVYDMQGDDNIPVRCRHGIFVIFPRSCRERLAQLRDDPFQEHPTRPEFASWSGSPDP